MGGVIAIIFLITLLTYFLFLTFIVYVTIVGVFGVLSYFGLIQLHTYGYTGDFCRPMIWIYFVLFTIVVMISFISLIISAQQ